MYETYEELMEKKLNMIERNIDKIQEMYDLGKSDINEKMESLLNYLEK